MKDYLFNQGFVSAVGRNCLVISFGGFFCFFVF